MKWSWKEFGLQLAVTFVVALGIAYGISKIIDATRGPGSPDSTLVSMALSGFLTPWMLSLIAGWKAWALKPPLIVSFLVSTIYTTNPAAGILCLPVSAALYFVARKCSEILAYYAPSKNVNPDPGE